MVGDFSTKGPHVLKQIHTDDEIKRYEMTGSPFYGNCPHWIQGTASVEP